jgi:hypothetical protein
MSRKLAGLVQNYSVNTFGGYCIAYEGETLLEYNLDIYRHINVAQIEMYL